MPMMMLVKSNLVLNNAWQININNEYSCWMAMNLVKTRWRLLEWVSNVTVIVIFVWINSLFWPWYIAPDSCHTMTPRVCVSASSYFRSGGAILFSQEILHKEMYNWLVQQVLFRLTFTFKRAGTVVWTGERSVPYSYSHVSDPDVSSVQPVTRPV